MPDDTHVSGDPGLAGGIRAIVLTGCSGSGKSSLLAALGQRGFQVVPEAGRQIVRQQMAIGGDALPWQDAAAFVELAATLTMAQFDAVRPGMKPVVFDRSIVDLVSFLDHKGLPVPEHLTRALALYRYASPVLVTSPWQGIYVDDGERMKSFEEAVAEYETLAWWYRAEHYALVEVPQAGIEQRADFCERLLRSPGAG